MKEPNVSQTSTAKVTWDDAGVPISTEFDDIYFSKTSGIEESRHVFVEGNKLIQRWNALTANTVFTIGETGFGSGLNFLAAWSAWRESTRPRGSRLHFYSVEKYPMSRRDLAKSLAFWPELQSLGQSLLDAYPPQPVTGLHRLSIADDVQLTLCFSDVAEGLASIAPASRIGPRSPDRAYSFGPIPVGVDAWFLDGFAPAKNPQMWRTEVFTALANLSKYGTSVATFTVAAAVRRGLANAGFACQKIAGFGRKREMLVAEYDNETPVTDEPRDAEPTWHLMQTRTRARIQHCIVIGAGLAGCHTANALARRNIRVSLLEKNACVAAEASGNHQGVVYARLSPHQDALSRFNLATLLFANQFYQSGGFYQDCGEQCGVLHLAVNEKHQRYYQSLAEQFINEPTFAQWLNQADCQDHCGIETAFPGLYLPQAGWLDPVSLCHKLIQDTQINLATGCEVGRIVRADNKWHALTEDGESLAKADAVIIANASSALRFEQTRELPLKAIRGQVSHISADKLPRTLTGVLCGDGYIAPAHSGRHTFGATFTLDSMNPARSPQDDQTNITRLASLSPEFADIRLEDLTEGRVGFRCATRDYLPVVGPVASIGELRNTFAPLRHNAGATVDRPGDVYPDLYCNLGHGSRGLCYTPLCADLLASLVSGELLPVSRSLYRHLHPARFLIRDISRRRDR